MLPYCSIDPAIADIIARRTHPHNDALENMVRRIANRHIIVDPLSKSPNKDDFGDVFQKKLGRCKDNNWNWIILQRPLSMSYEKIIKSKSCAAFSENPELRHLIAAITDTKVQVVYMLSETFEKLAQAWGSDSSNTNVLDRLEKMKARAVLIDLSQKQIQLSGCLKALEYSTFLFSAKWREDETKGLCLGLHLHAHSLDDLLQNVFKKLAGIYEDIYWFEPHLYGGVNESYRQDLKSAELEVCKVLVRLNVLGRASGRSVNIHLVSANKNKPPKTSLEEVYTRRRIWLQSKIEYKNIYCEYLEHGDYGKDTRWHDRFLVFRTRRERDYLANFVALVFSAPLGIRNDRLGPGLCGYRCPDDDDLLPREKVYDMLTNIERFEDRAQVQEQS